MVSIDVDVLTVRTVLRHSKQAQVRFLISALCLLDRDFHSLASSPRVCNLAKTRLEIN